MGLFKFGSKKKYEALGGDAEDFLLITWDSCRYDAYVKAHTPRLDAHCQARQAYAMATYTLPAHVAMFQGLLPHVFSAEPFYNRFVQQLWRISHRNVHIKPLVTFPGGTRSIVSGFRDRGYYTISSAAMDWFKDSEALDDGFLKYDVTGTAARKQNETLTRAIDKESAGRPCFAFVNYGETHSPFRHEGMAASAEVKEQFSLARLWNQRGMLATGWTFNQQAFDKQVACAEYLDARTGELIDFFAKRGRPTTIVVCGDHGECFGENGLYGHAFYHEKVMEVPLLIFRINAAPHAPPESSVEAPKREEKI